MGRVTALMAVALIVAIGLAWYWRRRLKDREHTA
jgi:hypothetical protein